MSWQISSRLTGTHKTVTERLQYIGCCMENASCNIVDVDHDAGYDVDHDGDRYGDRDPTANHYAITLFNRLKDLKYGRYDSVIVSSNDGYMRVSVEKDKGSSFSPADKMGFAMKIEYKDSGPKGSEIYTMQGLFNSDLALHLLKSFIKRDMHYASDVEWVQG